MDVKSIEGSKNRTRVCFPSAGVREVRDRLVTIMKEEGAASLVCGSVGGNYIGKVRSEELCRFRGLRMDS